MQTTAFLLETTRPLPITRLVRSRLLIGAVALGVIAVVAAWQWSWLVAIGVAPLLLTGAPCAAMCGLGLCMHRMAGRSCAANSQAPATQIDPGEVESSIDRKLNHGDLI
jgi:hypothetical protein